MALNTHFRGRPLLRPPAVTLPDVHSKSTLYTRGQAAIIALALLSHTGSAAGWAMLDCLSTESFDSSVRGAAHRRA